MRRMTRPLCLLMVVAMLFMGIDAAFDIARSGHAHADPTAQHDGHAGCANAPTGGVHCNADAPDSDHCEHCCHGHISMLAVSQPSLPAAYPTLQPDARSPILPADFALAPPTPPPNA